MSILAHNRRNVDKVDKVVSTPPNSAARITLSTSLAFVDKTPLKGVASFNMFAPQNMLPSDITAHILAGRAILPFAHKAGKRGHAYAISGQTMGLDFDGKKGPCVTLEMLQNHPMGGYIFFAHETPSSTPTHPRTRAYILIDTPIESAEEYECLVKALHTLFADYGPDESCTDSSRPFFGSKNAAHWTNFAAVLPLALLREHAEDIARAQRQAAAARPLWHERAYSLDEPLKSPLANRRLQGFKNRLQNLIEAQLHRISSSTEGNRDTTLTSAAGYILNYAATLHCPYSTSAAIDMMTSAAVQSGLTKREAESTIASIQRYARRPLIVPDFNDGEARGQNSARIENSPVRELTRYDLDSDGEPLASGHTAQDQSLSLYPSQLADSWMFDIEDVRGGLASGLLNAIYGLVHNRVIVPRFKTEELLEALAFAGYTFDASKIRKTLSALVKAELIDKCTTLVVFPKSAQYKKIDIYCEEDSLCAQIGKTKNAECVYQVLDTATLGQRIKARVFEALLDDFYSQNVEAASAELFAKESARAELMTDEDKRCTLDSLISRRDLNTLSKEAVYEAVPRHLKAMPRYKRDKEAAHENTRRKAVFYSVIRIVPPKVTAHSLMVTPGLYLEAAESAAKRLNAIAGQRDTHGLIDAKWNVLIKCHNRRVKALKNMITTPFAETDLHTAKAQLDALKRARHAAYDNMAVSGNKQKALLGVDNRSSAVRLSKRLGIRREERSERRAFTVNRIEDAPIPIQAVQEAIKGIVSFKDGEFATHVFSYGPRGELYDHKPFKDIEDMRIGGTSFEVHVQQISIIHVEAKPPRKERVKATSAAAESIPVESTPRRVHRTTLYTRTWVENNILAPHGIGLHKTSEGERFIALGTGEASQDLLSIIGEPLHAAVIDSEVS